MQVIGKLTVALVNTESVYMHVLHLIMLKLKMWVVM